MIKFKVGELHQDSFIGQNIAIVIQKWNFQNVAPGSKRSRDFRETSSGPNLQSSIVPAFAANASTPH